MNNNNPFESGNKKSNNPFESGNKKPTSYDSSTNGVNSNNNESRNTQSAAPNTNRKPKKQRRKRSYGTRIVWYIVVALLIPWVYSWDSSDSIFDLGTPDDVKELRSLDVVENYTYDFKDVQTDAKTNPFPKNLTKGQNYKFDQTDKRLVSTTDGTAINLVVGVDIKPGIYTIKTTGSVYIDTEQAVYTGLDYKDAANYYNIPLIEGDTIDIEFWHKNETGTVNLVSQDEYVNYKPGINGVFVYGLNQFDSEVELDADSYDSLAYGYNHPTLDIRTENFFYDEDVTLPGNPGSYFAIEYDNED